MTLDEALEAMKKEGILPEDADHLVLLDRLDDETRNVIPLKAAIQDPKTGKIYPGQIGDHHKDIAAKIEDPELKKVAYNAADKNENPAGGFVDSSGNFLSRDQAQKQYGIHTSQQLDDAREEEKLSTIAKLGDSGEHNVLKAGGWSMATTDQPPTQTWPGPTQSP